MDLSPVTAWGNAVAWVSKAFQKVVPNWIQKQTQKNNEIRNENYKVIEKDVADAAAKYNADKLHDDKKS